MFLKKINSFHLVVLIVLALILSNCSKKDAIQEVKSNELISKSVTTSSITTTTTFTTYLIRTGQHYCDQSTLKSVKTSEMKFVAIFDSSAIYQSINPINQLDINKLYGFSEGINNQYNSARIGWRWSDGALRLFGYVYKLGVRYSQEITSVPFNTDITCSIKLSGSNYIITAKGISITMPRGLSTSSASGYQQYPYFGGDEVAPHNIYIKIKNI